MPYVVDNRVFLIGLDELYRRRIAEHEKTELLRCAQRVAGVLGVRPASVPVEGYYAEDPDLATYFRLMRALQLVSPHREPEVAALPQFARLRAVTSSPIFGPPVWDGLLPSGRDPLLVALETVSRWTVPVLTAAAARRARETGDCSLVGLAAQAEDPVVLAALRESVVLYAGRAMFCGDIETWEWAVDPALAEAAQSFVDAFNALFEPGLPRPNAEDARTWWDAFRRADVVGRCVRLGEVPFAPARYYHWAVVWAPDGALAVHEFWDEKVWTTESYQASLTFHEGTRQHRGPP